MFKIRWIGQGGFILSLGNKTLCIDPYLSNSVVNLDGFERILPIPILPSELKADVIISTHDHMDHLDEETLKYTDFQSNMYAGPDSCINHFKAMGIKKDRIIELNKGTTIKVGEADVTAVYADHTEDSIGIIVSYEGISIYFVGDSLFNEKLLQVKNYKPDVLVTCINGKLGNMNYIEAGNLAKGIGVKVAVPCHYGMFAENTENPKNFDHEIKDSGISYFEFEFNKEYEVQDIL